MVEMAGWQLTLLMVGSGIVGLIIGMFLFAAANVAGIEDERERGE